MDDARRNELALVLANTAISRDTQPLVKIALDFQGVKNNLSGAMSNPYLRNAMLGAGAGGLLGLTSRKDKKRNALYYALMGGLGGAGLTAGMSSLSKLTEDPPKEVSAPIASKVGPVLKGVGTGAAALSAALGLGVLGTQGRRARAFVGRGHAGPLLRQTLRSFERMPRAVQIGVPLAGGALAWRAMGR
jgi:hypothetical protein